MRVVSSCRVARATALALVFLGLPTSTPARAQEAPPAQAPPRAASNELAADRALLASERYVLPPKEIADLVTGPRHLNVSLTRPSPDRSRFLVEQSGGMPPLTAFAKPHYYLGGLQVDFKANRARALTTRGLAGLRVVDPLTGAATDLAPPAGATVISPAWSPTGRQIAYIANFEDASHVYVADVATGRSRPVTPPRTPLLATLVTTIDWTADGRSVIVVLIPANRGPEPKATEVASGPLVQLWMDGAKSSQRMFANLLEDAAQQAQLEYYTTGQLALIDVQTRVVTPIGAPAMITAADASLAGRYFRVTTMQRPFSYVVQYQSFGTVEALWDASGKVLAEIRKRPLREVDDTSNNAPGFGGAGSRDEGPKRGLAWMPQGQGLSFIEPVPSAARADTAAGDAGPAPPPQAGSRGPRSGAGQRADRVVQWLPPFGPNDTTVLYRGDGPISQAVFSDDARTLFLAGTRNGTGEIVAVTLADPATKHVIVRGRGYTPAFAGDDSRLARFAAFGRRGGSPGDSAAFYTNPGAMMTKRGTLGGAVALVSSDGAVFLQGARYAPDWATQAPRAFVDKVTIATGAKTRIFESAADVSETVVTPLDDEFTRAVVSRESATLVPDAYLRDLKTGALTQLTANRDPAPAFTQAIRRRLWVTRADGIRFLVHLALPAGYQAGTRLPGMLWFYPYEYTDQAGYDRTLRTENINRFPASGPRTIEYLVTRGYAVANFDPPVIGDSGRMNDRYLMDLQQNLLAVVDELDRQGYVDRSRLGLGGHSYGAFSTANAMVHTPFFKAGIAGDGMYNRTLTPNGFQSERRDLWDGQRTYLELSPMLYAERLQGALLMYHSIEDQNVGTSPISSIRMMQALRANGKAAALFLYPYEDHGPAARETVLDQWARWTAWLDLYVKHAGESPPKPAVADGVVSSLPQP